MFNSNARAFSCRLVLLSENLSSPRSRIKTIVKEMFRPPIEQSTWSLPKLPHSKLHLMPMLLPVRPTFPVCSFEHHFPINFHVLSQNSTSIWKAQSWGHSFLIAAANTMMFPASYLSTLFLRHCCFPAMRSTDLCRNSQGTTHSAKQRIILLWRFMPTLILHQYSLAEVFLSQIFRVATSCSPLRI
jgi:hypothetical protein